MIHVHSFSSTSFALLIACVGPSCTGTEADNPFADVDTTRCKSDEDFVPNPTLQTWATRFAEPTAERSKQLGSKVSQLEAALTAAATLPIGLRCIEWQLSGDFLDVQIVNFSGGCSIDWEGGANLDGDTLLWQLRNPSCDLARCGSCIYDTITRVSAPSAKTLRVELTQSTCKGEQRTEGEWTLPVGTEPQGLRCDFADSWGVNSVAGATGLGGTAFTSCAEAEDEAATSQCEEALQCVPVAEADWRCLPPCTQDEDCSLGDTLQCSDGFCRPR